MKLRTILGGTAIATLALFTNVGVTALPSFVSQAEAATTVSISVFYDELADHGDWVRYRDSYVFIPANVDRGWRPYTVGRWLYAENIGWTWASDEPFGWATYHYGRWGYGDDIGWYWVPGTRWAPAWVSWRRDSDHVVWAPLPPRRDNDVDVSISISVGDIPDFYWVAVPTRSFISADLRVSIIRDDRERRRIIRQTEFLGTPRVENNIVVNNVINVNIIEKETGRKVRRVEARRTTDLREARVSGDQVTVFEGQVERNAEAKPKRVRDVKEARKIKRSADESAGTADPETDQSTGSLNANQPDAGDAADQNTTQRKRKARNSDTNEDAANPAANDAVRETAETPEGDAAEEGNAKANKKPRKKPTDAEASKSDEATDQAPAQTRKKKRAAEQNATEDNETDQAPAQNRKKKRAVEQGASEADDGGSSQASKQQRQKNRKANDNANSGDEQGQSAQKNKRKRKQQGCDPETNANCPAQ